jgi:hypothetical protein
VSKAGTSSLSYAGVAMPGSKKDMHQLPAPTTGQHSTAVCKDSHGTPMRSVSTALETLGCKAAHLPFCI